MAKILNAWSDERMAYMAFLFESDGPRKENVEYIMQTPVFTDDPKPVRKDIGKVRDELVAMMTQRRCDERASAEYAKSLADAAAKFEQTEIDI